MLLPHALAELQEVLARLGRQVRVQVYHNVAFARLQQHLRVQAARQEAPKATQCAGSERNRVARHSSAAAVHVPPWCCVAHNGARRRGAE